MNIFQNTSSCWVKYSEYKYRKSANGIMYIVPTADSKLKIYDPLENAEIMILEALNVGMLAMNRKDSETQKQAITQFVSKYGLLGFMTALPTTPKFMDYDAVYLPKNNFIKAEAMSTQEYIAPFYPFNKPDFHKDSRNSQWNISGDTDMKALALTMGDKPLAVNMCLGRDYAERYDWLIQQFKDWAFTFSGAFMYYNDYDNLNEDTRNLYRKGMAAFEGVSPTYHIELLEKPTIIWDFHSLLLGIQMMFSFMLTDDSKPLRLCKNCVTVFKAGRANSVFCSPSCKNQYGVDRNRGRR